MKIDAILKPEKYGTGRKLFDLNTNGQHSHLSQFFL